MAGKSPKGPNKPSAYGSAADLPSYRELTQEIQGFKLLTLFIARGQREEILVVERQMKRLTRVVDDFYERLGPRNWIFHDMLSVDSIEQLLAETSDGDIFMPPHPVPALVHQYNWHPRFEATVRRRFAEP